MELNISHRTIKKDFIFIVLFSSFIPFVISLVPLWFIVKNSNEKSEQVNAQRQHTQELEILDSFHKSMGQVYKTIQSVDIHEYFSANTDSEPLYREKLEKYLLNLNSSVPFKNVHWIIFGSRGNILLSTDKSERINNIDIHLLNGASFNPITNEVILSLPLFYYPINTIYAFVALEIPLTSVQREHPYLNDIKNLPQDLSALKFKADFSIPIQNNSLIYSLYFYILIFILFNLCAVYFGIKLLQDKIVSKLKLLSVRILNDINSLSKIMFDSPRENEIDSLSLLFNNYMKYVKFLQYEIEKSSQLAAVGHIAHTIAHDLRKPFSNTTLFLEQVEKIESVDEIRKFVQEYRPVLKNSIFYVEHLLKEIMEAGVSQLNISLVKLEDILLKSFSNCIQKGPCHVDIEYRLECARFLKVDELRIVRVFSNLISNALEAMNFRGKIWIVATKSLNHEFVEIMIGNNNSYIDQRDISNLFEPFYTKNKKNGTGLGLSIAQKIVHLHGGSIHCQSIDLDTNKKVEFILTLPLVEDIYTPELRQLPKSLSSLASVPRGELQYSENRIIILDDDPFICRSWKRLVSDAKVISFLYPEDFLKKIESEPHFLGENSILVSDFNFGVGSKFNFYEFTLELRKFYCGVIFLSTDALDEDLDLEFLTQNKVLKIKKSSFSFLDLCTLAKKDSNHVPKIICNSRHL